MKKLKDMTDAELLMEVDSIRISRGADFAGRNRLRKILRELKRREKAA